MGIRRKTWGMKWILVFVAIASIGFAHQTEPDSIALDIPAPPGEDDTLAMIQEGADVTKYRISWKTKADPCPASGSCTSTISANKKFASNMNFKITITGKGGSVEDEVFKHPGETKNGETWSPQNGLVQHGVVDPKKDLGQISSVKITGTGGSSTSWTPAFVKINTNNQYTGLGSGVYYVPVNRAIDKDNGFEAKVAPGDGEVKMEKCQAQYCEKMMDAKMALL